MFSGLGIKSSTDDGKSLAKSLIQATNLHWNRTCLSQIGDYLVTHRHTHANVN